MYWESRVKTYGFQVFTGLSLVEIVVAPGRLVDWGKNIRAWENTALHFVFVLIRQAVDGGFRFHLLMKGREHEAIQERCLSLFPEEERDSVRITSPVEMIHFQGPHFGDRYGIVDTAFNALTKAAVPILAAACTGASIHLVLPEKKSETARSVLEELFEIPGRSGKRRRPPEEDRS